MKKQFVTLLTMILVTSLLLMPRMTVAPQPPLLSDTLIIATTSEPETVDPAWAYDTASLELISNVYDTLMRYDRESLDEFVPCLATDWGMSEDGLTFWFKIREGVKFHNGDILTTEDVEYSFERWMVQDRDGGPTWMILEPLFGVYSTADLGDVGTSPGRAEIATKIDNAVVRNNTHVQFNLVETFASTIFYQTIAQPFGSILNKHWCIDHGDWPGTWDNWINYYDPVLSPLEDPPTIMGTGPYKFDYWNKGAEWSIVKNDSYWQGWPAPRCGGYVERVTVKLIPEWVTRKLMFLAGDCDLCYVPKPYIDQILGEPGIRCIYPLPSLSVDNLFFQFDIDPTTPFCLILPTGTFDESGIPSDFFGNPDWGVHLRKAFAYCIDFDTFIAEVFGGEATVPATAIISGLFGYDPTIEGYSYNLANAEEHFKSVPGLWETGFTITIPYYTGSYYIQTVAEMLKASVEALNPKFHVTTLSLDWTSYLRATFRGQLPCFLHGWIADYPDPHNFVVPFYASYGMFAHWQGYSNPEMDTLIDEGIGESDPGVRISIYHYITELAIEDCPSVPLYQPIGRHFERDWVQGWYYNPIYPGNYYYHLWKGEWSSASEDQIVIEEVIDPPNLTTDLIALRLSRPLQLGDVITPVVNVTGHGHLSTTSEYKSNGTVWFYWLNDCPYAMFAHKTRYVFVDNATGEYEVMYVNWPPALNGEEIWRTPEEYWNPENWVYSSTTNFSQPTATIEVSGSVNLVASKSSFAITPENQPCKRALIIEGHNPYGSDFQNASELWYNLMVNFTYTDEEIIYLTPGMRPKTDFICSKENVTSVIQNLANTLKPGDNLTLFIVAHGCVLDDNHTGIIFLDNWSDQLYDWELKQSLSEIEDGVNMTIAFESCYSGGFMDDLWTLGNVKVMITSTDWKSESYYASAGLDPPTFYNGIKPEEWAWNDTNIWDEGGEFSSGLIERLNELKDAFAADQITLGDLYVNACKRAKEIDAGYQNGDVLKAHYNDPVKKPNPLLNTVFFQGDITHDGTVNILDISKAARAYQSKPGDSYWDPEADIDKSREIRIVDITKIAVEFGTRYY